MAIKAILFDLDGTLVESTEWHVEALNMALKLNKEEIISDEDEKILFENNGPGMSTKQKLEILHVKRNLPKNKFDKIYEDKKILTEEVIRKRCKINVKIIELLEKIKKCGYKMAICSNAGRSSVDSILKKMTIEKYFSIVITNNDVENRKPHPEAYLKAVDFFNLKPWECLAIEDSNKGYESAKRAGCFVMKVENPKEISVKLIKDNIKQKTHINVIIPAAGEGSRFSKAGYKNPKPFIDVNGKCMLHRVLDDLKSEKYTQKYFVLIKKEHYISFAKNLADMKKEYDVEFIPIDVKTEGTACTVLFARNYITNCPTVVANSDELVDVSIDELIDDMLERNLNGNILVFNDKELNPKWSFVEVDKNNLALRTKEKEAISQYATAGLYCFDNGLDLMDSCVEMIVRNDRSKDEFYFCPVYNHFIKRSKKVGIYEIEQNKMHGLGTPEDLKYYLLNHAK